MDKHSDSHDSHGSSHYIKIWGILLVLLVISICGPMIGIQWLTMVTAFGIAIVKATIVAREFMHLKSEQKIITYIFTAMLALVFIFYFGTVVDVLKNDGQNWVKTYDEAAAEAKAMKEVEHGVGHAAATEEVKQEEAPKAAPGKSRFSKAWIATPEMVANGKQQYQSNCATCHGPEGKGDGVAAAGLNPKPRNFTVATGWKQGRKPSQIFNTVTKGFAGMPSFASLSTDDRWSLVHYVRTMGPHAGEKDSNADLAKIGIDPTKDNGGGGGGQEIPIGLAIDQMSVEPAKK